MRHGVEKTPQVAKSRRQWRKVFPYQDLGLRAKSERCEKKQRCRMAALHLANP